ncbi:vicilin-like seed storage protein At2g18540 [Arapaima gigas]
MAEEQNGNKWKEYLEDRLEARLLQESIKMEQRLRQERMLILNLVEQKMKRTMNFRNKQSSTSRDEAGEDEKEQRNAWKWLDKQLVEGVAEKEWDLQVETRDLRNGQRNRMWQKVVEEIQQVMGLQEQEESGRRKNKVRGKKITVKESVVKMPEQKEVEINDRQELERQNRKRRVMEMEEEMNSMMEENWEGTEERKKEVSLMRSDVSRTWMGARQQKIEELVKEREQRNGARAHDIVTWMEDTKKAILELIGIRWKDREDIMEHSLTGPLLTPEQTERNREELKLLAMSKPKLHTDFSIFMNG